MNLAFGTLVTALALSPQTAAPPPPPTAASALEYALPALRGPCLSAPCAGSLVTDFAVDLAEPGGARTGEARLLVDRRFYLGVRADETSRGLAFETARWDVELEHRDDSTGVGAEYRGRGLRLEATARDHDPAAGDGWLFAAEAALRLGPDLEVVVAALEDDRAGFVPGTSLRPTSSLTIGALWQRGARLDLGGFVRSETLSTPAGLELDRRAVEIDATYQARRWSLSGDLALDELSGRFERQEAAAAARLTYRITDHLVASAEAGERYDLDLGSVGNTAALELAYYGRRFRFARGGEAGRRTVELARRALELGYNERRLHGLEGRRRLRQRLALSGARDELAPLVDALYAAQIDERNVPLAGVALRRGRDEIEGSRTRETEVFLAVPWPRSDGPHPLRHDESATEFLRFTYGWSERDISSGFTTEGQLLAVDVSLRRELGLRFSWREPAATGLEFALRTQQPRVFLAQLVYRQGI